MNVTDIPFVQHIGIEKEKNECLLGRNDNIMNHISTIHAGAQFTLAETQSGVYLQTLFPDLEGKVVSVLRDAQIKYKKPAASKIRATATVDKDALEKFKMQFEKKKRGLIEVMVDVTDNDNTLVSQAVFTWFVQEL